MDTAILYPPTSLGQTVVKLLEGFIRLLATVFTSVGEDEVADFINGDGSAPANYFIAWGTDNTTADKADTTLGIESAETRATGVNTQPTADTNQWVGTLTSLSTQSIAEMGLLDLVTGGNLFIRKDYAAAFDLETDDQIEFTVTLEMQ